MQRTCFDKQSLVTFKSALSTAGRIVITCHLSPDGDALGSSLGLMVVVSKLNPRADVVVITPDEPSHNLSFLPNEKKVIAYSSHPTKAVRLIERADVIVCLDFNALSRTDLLAPYLAKSKAFKILVDHHIEPENFADVIFSYPEKCSTCMLLFEILEEAGMTGCVTSDAANCLLAGMMTDTGDFSYSVSDPYIYTVIGRLIELGADKGRLTHLLFNTFSETNLRIQGFALADRMEVFQDMHAALIVLSRDDLNARGYRKGDTEGLVNKPLAIPGIIYSCYLREEANYIKVSMRSLGDFPVNRLCSEYFGGGGHLNAAGGEYHGSLDNCAQLFRDILDESKKKYIDNNEVIKRILHDEGY